LASMIKRAKAISPSKLYWFSVCPLRYLLSTEGNLTVDLPSIPVAAIGTAVHRVIEQSSGVPTARAALKQRVRDQVEADLKRAAARNRVLDYVAERFGLDCVFSNQQLLGAVRLIERACPRTEDHLPGDHKGSGRATPSRQESESDVDSESLDIHGSMDRVTYNPDGTIEVEDFKTGRVLNEEGGLKQEYFYQMACYGLTLREKFPLAKITLRVIGPNDDWEAEFVSSMEASAKDLIDALDRSCPREGEFDQASLARIGLHCSSCSQRAACVVYEQSLKLTGFVSEPMGRVFDVFGSIDSVQSYSHGLSAITIRSRDGAFCRVSNIPTSIVGCIESSDAEFLCFSGVSSRMASSTEFPSNLEVVNLNEPSRSAFAFVMKPTT